MIKYNPRIPRLEGMTDKQRCDALERYMTESAKQINLLAAHYEKKIKELKDNAETETV